MSQPRVAFQGEPGAFSELAIRQAWPDGAETLPCASFDEAIAAVLDDTADFAVIPIENAIAGAVVAAQAALAGAESRVRHVMEMRVPVHLHLMAPAGATIEQLRTVRSHPVALAQCRIFLARHPWIVPVPHADTAGAALDVARDADRTVAAVASEAAARRYDLQILADRIEDVRANSTRFVIVERS